MSNYTNEFLATGFIKFKNNNPEAFEKFQSTLISTLGPKESKLENMHSAYTPQNINPKRIEAFTTLNKVENWKELYFSMFAPFIDDLIGKEISIQNKLNLSIQMPYDESSVLPIHTDRAGGQSLFELVAWCSFTTNTGTECMYVLDPETSLEIHQRTGELELTGLEKVLDEYENKVNYIDVKEGDCILFSGNLLHGNVCNQGTRTRVSTNTRFKALWAPEYKKINNERITGSFYEPMRFSPSSKFALRFLNNGPHFND